MNPHAALSDSEPLDEAEQVLLQALHSGAEFGTAELELICKERPELEARMRQIYSSFAAARDALRSARSGAGVARASRSGEMLAGRFWPLEEIGRGGMSIVVSAWDERLRRKVALKSVRWAIELGSRDPALLARRRALLASEGQVLAQLDHPAIVPVYDVVQDGGEIYLAMLRVRGSDLREAYRAVWSGAGEWSLTRVLSVLQTVCEAVAFAHQKGVLHRDLKPANVMVGSFGETYVMDWGLARTRDETVSSSEAVPDEVVGHKPGASVSYVVTDRDAAAVHGTIVGTPSYMAPEQAEGDQAIDARADVYGIGAMLYELLAHRAPYLPEGETRSSAQILTALRTAPPTPLTQFAHNAPPELVAIADKAMARDREHRYPTMRELADDLRAYLEGRVVRAHRTGAWAEIRKWIARHRVIVALLTALLSTVIAAAIGFGFLYAESTSRLRRMRVAHADVQRRINSLRGFAFDSVPAPGFHDDFATTPLHRRWITTSRGDLISIRDGALILEALPDAPPTRVQLDQRIGVLRGDFDLRVAFRLEGFSVPSFRRGTREAEIRIEGLFTEIATKNDEWYNQTIAIGRYAELEPPAWSPEGQSYRSFHGGQFQGGIALDQCVTTTAMSGRFRICRSGDVCTTYYEVEDDWKKLLSHPIDPSQEFGIVFHARSWYSAEPFSFCIEDVQLITSSIANTDPASEIRDGFEEQQLDSRYALFTSNGITAPVDGRLYLEAMGNGAGHVRLTLDRTRWRIEGDFDLSVDFELVSFAAGPGSARVTLQATTADDMEMATVGVVADANGQSAVAYFYRETATRPFSGSRGSFRIVRAGTVLRMMITTAEGESTLLERPQVGPGMDFAFALDLVTASGNEDALVAFDNLRVTSLKPR